MSEDKVKIAELEMENIKRTRKIHIKLTDGLNVIGGANHQGKTSILDGIAMAIGGARQVGSNPINNDAKLDEKRTVASTQVEFSNGVLAKRGFTVKNEKGNLVVKLPSGREGNQSDLDEIVSSFALNIGTFMNCTERERTDMFLKTIGVDLKPMQEEWKKVFDARTLTWQKKEDCRGHADDLPSHEDAPAEELSAVDVSKQLQEAMEFNQAIIVEQNELENARRELAQTKTALEQHDNDVEKAEERIKQLEKMLVDAKEAHESLKLIAASTRAACTKKQVDLHAEEQRVSALVPIDTTPIQARMADIENINKKVRDNKTKEAKYTEADELMEEYRAESKQLEEIRKRMADMLPEEMPVPGMVFDCENMTCTYAGETWDSMSHSQQVIMAIAVARLANPNCGFVIADKLESWDINTLRTVAAWCEKEGIQIIGTRVSSNAEGECTFLISDGLVEGATD